ncbi:MAG TPA: dCTP deaminase [Bryobacteraceae bacterium]|jgi:dCTP deaminase|nr:dCTP deaminase [Bryobacteraceae bacterium]
MILSNDGIRRALEQGALEISPAPSDTQYTTSAVDLFLGDEFHVWDVEKLKFEGFKPQLDLSRQEFAKTARAFLIPLRKESDGSVIFPPFREHPWHILAITRERIHLNRNFKLAARVEGRSSLARIGIIVHLTAPTIHAGFNGKITLEMINFSPFYLRMVPNETQICQLIVERLESEPTLEIQTAFQGQTLPSGEKK